jgi:hypothetical protein
VLKGSVCILRKQDEIYYLVMRFFRNKIIDSSYCNPRSLIKGISVNTCGDGWKGNGADLRKGATQCKAVVIGVV